MKLQKAYLQTLVCYKVTTVSILVPSLYGRQLANAAQAWNLHLTVEVL